MFVFVQPGLRCDPWDVAWRWSNVDWRIVAVSESDCEVGSLLLWEPRQVEGQVQGGEAREQEPEIPLGQDDGKPESLEGTGSQFGDDSGDDRRAD